MTTQRETHELEKELAAINEAMAYIEAAAKRLMDRKKIVEESLKVVDNNKPCVKLASSS